MRFSLIYTHCSLSAFVLFRHSCSSYLVFAVYIIGLRNINIYGVVFGRVYMCVRCVFWCEWGGLVFYLAIFEYIIRLRE